MERLKVALKSSGASALPLIGRFASGQRAHPGVRRDPRLRATSGQFMPGVLVVDDEYYPRSAVAMVPRIKGFQIISAESPQAGLQIFQKSQLDLAVIDIFLQDVMTGIELIGLLRERDPTLPIIISGPMALDSCDEYFGHVKRLSKPLRPAELMLAIDTAMRSMLR